MFQGVFIYLAEKSCLLGKMAVLQWQENEFTDKSETVTKTESNIILNYNLHIYCN
jgi:hypothetical protein